MRILKTTVLFFLILISAVALQAQPLFTYGTHRVSKEEFLKAFQKNNTDAKPDKKAYDEYLELYIRFKLKVQAALKLRLDTLPAQLAELRSFRGQIANGYMNDEASMNILAEEAMKRSTKDISLSHIYVAFNNDSAAARAKINAAYAALKKGARFEDVADRYSEDPEQPTHKGKIGYITAFTLPYDLENLAYNTGEGQYSSPYKSKIGFHIFRNNGSRKAAGRIRLAQILLNFPPDATPAQKEKIAQRADSLYQALKAGSDFAALAAAFSEDNFSYQNGGELQEFGTGHYDPEFEERAFSLKADGELAPPFASKFGYHILKRLERKPLANDIKNANDLAAFRQQVAQSDRMELAQKMLLKKIMQQVGYRKISTNTGSINRIADSVLAGKPQPVLADAPDGAVLFTLSNQKYTVKDWIDFLGAVRSVTNAASGKTNADLFDQFVEISATDYYRNHLEQYNKEFAYQLHEFRDGNLLFEIMQRKIWDMGSGDTIGLKRYYQENKQKYFWEASADVLILTASNDSIAKAAQAMLRTRSGRGWREWIDQSNGTLQGDSGRFELSQLPVVERTNFTVGLVTAPVKSEVDNSSSFSYIIKLYPDHQQRNFEEARGFVINDYQNFLEEKWVRALKQEYPVKINQQVLASVYAAKP